MAITNTRQKGNRKFFRYKKEEEHRINSRIQAAEIRLVGEGITPSIYKRETALQMAQEKSLDLVQISDKGDFPVCKIMDYSKFKYERKKQTRVKDRANKVTIKEIRLPSNIGEHDFEFKKKHAINFLSHGDTVKAFIFFRKRRDFYIHKELAKERLKDFVEAMEAEGGKIKAPVKLLGRQMFVIIEPPKGGKK